MPSCNRQVTSTSIHIANQARLVLLAVTHRYMRARRTIKAALAPAWIGFAGAA